MYNELAAVVQLEIFYLDDFKATLYLVPASTFLKRNPGDLGELIPKAIFTVTG